jgi:DNA-binding Lrp family transcriptional regulator
MSKYKIIATLFDHKTAVTQLLQDNPDGQNMIMISKEVGLTYHPVRKIVQKLVAEKTVKEESFGMNKVYYID